jgi:hypothetical protein
MARFRVTLQSSKFATDAISVEGKFGYIAIFHIERLEDGNIYSYEGRAMGEVFESRCERLVRAEGVTVEAAESSSGTPDTTWKEQVMNLALAKAETLSPNPEDRCV